MNIHSRQAMKITLLCLSFFSLYSLSFAGTVKGHLYDKTTKEQLVGAYVTIKSISKGAVTELDGSFTIYDVPVGSYTLTISYLGYESIDSSIIIADKDMVLTLDIEQAPSSTQMKEVVIKTAANGTTDEYARRAEQKSLSLINIVSANAIALSPDITVANVMQRVSGVTMDKGRSGEAQYAIIRGMDKKYNVTLVNGIKIASPNDQDRYVPLDIFPAEMVDRIEVVKTLLPSMEGDATGGIVNLIMKSAPSKMIAEGNVGLGYCNIFQNQDFLKFDTKGISWRSPAELLPSGINATVSDFSYHNFITTSMHTPINSTGSITLGNRFYKKKLGVLISGSFQNTERATNSDVLQQVATVPPSTSINSPLIQPFSDIIVRQYSFHTERLGVQSKVDYEINDRNSISLTAMYVQLNEFRVLRSYDSLLGGSSLANYVLPIGYTLDLQTRQKLQNIYNITLQGKHQLLNALSADWSLAASQAKQQLPDVAKFGIKAVVYGDTTTNKITLGTPYVASQTHEWLHNTDNSLSGYLNFHYLSNLIPGLTNIDFGGMYRNTRRDNYDNKYKLSPVIDSNSTTESFTSIPNSKFYFGLNEGLGSAANNPGIYNFTENIMAYYLQLHKSIGDKIKLDGGFRIESTDQNYTSSQPASIAGKYGVYNYIDFLPSIMGKYELSNISAIRASYFKSINRPAFSQLIPYSDNSQNENYSIVGNPYLQHSIIDNYDLRYERFRRGLDQILIGVFYKNLQNPIEYALIQDGYSSGEVLKPSNYNAANNYGLELVYRKFFGNFGVSANYTYTKSVIDYQKGTFYISSKTGLATYGTTTENGPLQGQSPHIANLSFLYKNVKNNLEFQLAFAYVGERIYALSPYKGLDNWEKPYYSMDFSAQKKFGKHFTAYFKANNLLNNGNIIIIKQPNGTYSGSNKLPFQESGSYTTVQKDVYYSTFLLGVRFKFDH